MSGTIQIILERNDSYVTCLACKNIQITSKRVVEVLAGYSVSHVGSGVGIGGLRKGSLSFDLGS